MMLIVNPRATTVSGRLKKLVVYALRGAYEVNAVETEGPNHATELSREAAADGYDLAVAFGGDGTVNEVANGLAGSEMALSLLPGGCTNVVCRMLGIPTDIIDATEHLLALADDLRTWAIDLGKVNDRYFVSSGGLGLDAETTRWVDDRPHFKRRAGPFFFSVAGAMTFRRNLHSPPRFTAEAGGRRVEGISAVVQNSDPYTFFSSRPVRVCEGTQLDSGVLSMVVLKSARRRDMPGLSSRLLTGRPTIGHSQTVDFGCVERASFTSAPPIDGIPQAFPVQVDGDCIGDFTEAEFTIHPAALRVVR